MTAALRTPCDRGVIESRPGRGGCGPHAAPWVLAATIIASGMTFIDGTVVNVALPALQARLGATMSQAQWVVEAFAKLGITYRHSEVDRSMIYLDCLPLFTSGRARLIDSPRLVAQFSALERRTFPTGKDRVDHGRAGRDDACNAAAGALVLAARPVFDDVPIVMPFVFSNGPRNIPGQHSPRVI